MYDRRKLMMIGDGCSANLKIGWHEVYARKGVFELIAVSSVITMFLGVIQVLSEPLANSSLDYLARINIPDELQGRVWGFIGFISQLGYIPAYALSGVLADRAGSNLNIGVGRGAALIIAVAGTLLVITSLAALGSRRIRNLENAAELVINTGNEKGETDSYNQQD